MLLISHPLDKPQTQSGPRRELQYFFSPNFLSFFYLINWLHTSLSLVSYAKMPFFVFFEGPCHHNSEKTMDSVSEGPLKIKTSHCGKAVASPAAVLPTRPLTFITNNEVYANKAVSHFQLKCTSVGFPSSATFSLSPSQPRALYKHWHYYRLVILSQFRG